jgi:hypothetical protein
MRYTFPTDYADRKCYLVPINASLIPFVAGALKHFEERRSWHSDAEHQIAYNAFLELEICMTRLCVDDLIESNDRLYRMIDTALYGTSYEVTSAEPLIVEPQIWPTHELVIANADSLLGRAEDLKQLLQNALNGTSTTLYTRENGIRDLLELIQTALDTEAGIDGDMLAKLAEIALVLA